MCKTVNFAPIDVVLPVFPMCVCVYPTVIFNVLSASAIRYIRVYYVLLRYGSRFRINDWRGEKKKNKINVNISSRPAFYALRTCTNAYSHSPGRCRKGVAYRSVFNRTGDRMVINHEISLRAAFTGAARPTDRRAPAVAAAAAAADAAPDHGRCGHPKTHYLYTIYTRVSAYARRTPQR